MKTIHRLSPEGCTELPKAPRAEKFDASWLLPAAHVGHFHDSEDLEEPRNQTHRDRFISTRRVADLSSPSPPKSRCGLVTQALNMLPVGQIDGGRVTQTGFGRRALGLTSLGVYIGLSLGLIASSLSLSWALYVLICQRTPEFSPQDDVTEVDEARQRTALLLIFLAFLVLLPGGQGVSQDVMRCCECCWVVNTKKQTVCS